MKKPIFSLLQYADDALIFGEWLRRNVKNLISILNSFRDVSGLGVNLSKSSIFGVGVNIEEVKNVASSSKCKFGSLLFIHLGLPVGRDMSKERWLDAGPILMERFPRLYALESNKNCSLRDRCARVDNGWRCLWEWRVPPRSRASSDCHRLDSLVCDISLRDGYSDGWDWLPNSGNAFIVKHLSKMIDDITLGENNLEVIAGSFVKLLPPRLQNILQGVCLVTLWSVWKWRNKVAHFTIESKYKEQGADNFSMIQANSLLWISNRWSKKSVIPNWKSWVNRPRGIYDDIANLST
ncbi:reverse transcriptase domain, reverse transcriptase zinc-binding domain protein [Tanacetum coccineum]